MPTYEYGCTACGNEFELEQRISEPPIKKCPKCGKNKAARQISAGNFILKGGGWYADGYGSKGSSSPKKVDTGSTTKGDTKSDTKSETKSESKPEPKAEKSEKPRAAAAAE